MPAGPATPDGWDVSSGRVAGAAAAEALGASSTGAGSHAEHAHVPGRPPAFETRELDALKSDRLRIPEELQSAFRTLGFNVDSSGATAKVISTQKIDHVHRALARQLQGSPDTPADASTDPRYLAREARRQARLDAVNRAYEEIRQSPFYEGKLERERARVADIASRSPTIAPVLQVEDSELARSPEAAALRRAVTGRADLLMSEQSLAQRGPVLTGVMDLATGERFFGTNSGLPENLHPLLSARMDAYVAHLRDSGLDYRAEFRFPGEHSEINALNAALHAREASTGEPVHASELEGFLCFNVRLQGARSKGSEALRYIPPCDDCDALTRGVSHVGPAAEPEGSA